VIKFSLLNIFLFYLKKIIRLFEFIKFKSNKLDIGIFFI